MANIDTGYNQLLLPTVLEGRRNTPTLQPAYFTSSLFVDPLRRDISKLLQAFLDRVTTEVKKSTPTAHHSHPGNHDDNSSPHLPPHGSLSPFQWFKEIWKAQKWDYLHLKVLEPRARRVFLETVMRLFLERMVPPEPVLNQMTAFFGLYSFYSTQPPSEMAYRQTYIHIPINVYEYLTTLPSILPSGFDLYISYILHTFTSSHAFALIPAAHLGPYDPSILPQTHIGSVGALDGQVDTEGEKQQSGDETEHGAKTGVTEEGDSNEVGPMKPKPGRQTSADQQKRASRSALALEDWVNRMGGGNIKSGEENGRGKRSARNGPPSNSAVDVEKEGSKEQSVEASESKAKAEEEYFRSKEDLLKLAMLSPPHATIQDEEDDHQMEVDFVLPSTTNRTPKSLREALSEAESLAVQDIRELDALVRSRGWNIPLGASLLERAESQLGTGDGLEGRDVEIGGLLKMVHRSESDTGAPEKKVGTGTSRRKKN